MSDIEQKALALVKAVGAERQRSFYTRTINRRVDTDEALCRAIEQHEAFRQEVSNIVNAYVRGSAHDAECEWEKLNSLIIPKPKPDPLVAALEGVTFDHYPPNDAKTIRAALEARGLKIVEVKNDE